MASAIGPAANDPWHWESMPKADRQAQHAAVTWAEQMAVMFDEDDDDPIEAQDVVPFLEDALRKSPWDRPGLIVTFDLDDDRLSGLFDGGVVRLHPMRLSRRAALHEVAHFVAPHASHGPAWCRVYVDLIAAGLGVERGERLLQELREAGALILPAPS